MLFYERLESPVSTGSTTTEATSEIQDQQQQTEAEVLDTHDQAQVSSEQPAQPEQPAETCLDVTSDEAPSTVDTKKQEVTPDPHQTEAILQQTRSTPNVMRTSRSRSKKTKSGFLQSPRQVAA